MSTKFIKQQENFDLSRRQFETRIWRKKDEATKEEVLAGVKRKSGKPTAQHGTRFKENRDQLILLIREVFQKHQRKASDEKPGSTSNADAG